MTELAQDSLGIFVIPATLAQSFESRVHGLETCDDELLLDSLNALYEGARVGAIHSFETPAADSLSAWLGLAPYLRNRTAQAFNPPLIGPDQVKRASEALDVLERQASLEDWLDELFARERGGDRSASRSLYRVLRGALQRAEQERAAVFVGRLWAVPKDEAESEDVPAPQPTPEQVADLERWLEQQRELPEEEHDYYGFFVVPVVAFRPIQRIFAEGEGGDDARRVASQCQAFEAAQIVALDAIVSSAPEELRALNEHDAWLARHTSAWRGFGAYAADEVRSLADALVGLAQVLESSTNLSSARRRVQTELQRALTSARSRRAALVVTRSLSV